LIVFKYYFQEKLEAIDYRETNNYTSLERMVKKYRRLTDEERKNLVILIHREGYTIKDASRQLNIPYPNAKAVN